jgi:hypothetical protein
LFEKFLSANVDSFRQRYEGTYGFYRDEKKKRLLVRLDSISAEECTFVNADGIDFRLRVDTARDIGFEFLPPKSAWYNTEAGAVWTQRLAQRQFSRGVTSKNLEISLLTPDRGLSAMRVDFKTLSSIYERAITPALAIEALGKKSVAISSAFALDQSGVVYLFKEVIGSYKQQDKRLVFKLNEPKNWRTEISDACMAIDFTAEIS